MKKPSKLNVAKPGLRQTKLIMKPSLATGPNTPAVEGTSEAPKPPRTSRRMTRAGGPADDVLKNTAADPTGNDASGSSQQDRPSSSQVPEIDSEEDEKILQRYAVLKNQGVFSTPPPLDSAETAFKEVAKNMGLLMKFKRVSS